MSDAASEQPSFEASIDQLETLIDKIESGEVGLEEAMKHYESGQMLIQRCRTILDAAERKIAELTEDAEGHLVASEADNDDADDDFDDEDHA